jgi:vacuolar protein sorting-associated protein 13A/C
MSSLELVGNPIGLVSSLGVGVRDFFYEPAHALITSPTEIGKIGRGVVKGAISVGDTVTANSQ